VQPVESGRCRIGSNWVYVESSLFADLFFIVPALSFVRLSCAHDSCAVSALAMRHEDNLVSGDVAERDLPFLCAGVGSPDPGWSANGAGTSSPCSMQSAAMRKARARTAAIAESRVAPYAITPGMDSTSAHQRPSSSRPATIGIDSTPAISMDLRPSLSFPCPVDAGG
jgi:hypothetical protein